MSDIGFRDSNEYKGCGQFSKFLSSLTNNNTKRDEPDFYYSGKDDGKGYVLRLTTVALRVPHVPGNLVYIVELLLFLFPCGKKRI